MSGTLAREIEILLQEAFLPTRLDVINDSARHHGHAGDRVAWLGRPSEAWYEIFFGVAKARACFAPINSRLAVPEIAFEPEGVARAVWPARFQRLQMLQHRRKAHAQRLRRLRNRSGSPAQPRQHFDEAALDEAIAAFSGRERRFGKTSEQILSEHPPVVPG